MSKTLPLTPRKLAAHLRKRGWRKSSMQMTRMGTTYMHPEVPGTMVTYAKNGVDSYIVTGKLTAISRLHDEEMTRRLEDRGISLDGLNRHTPNLDLLTRIVDSLSPEQEGGQ